MSALADYADAYPTEVSATFTIDGARVRWLNVQEPDLSRIVPRIREHATNFRQSYQVDLDDDNLSDIVLRLRFKRSADRVDLIRAKGDVLAMLVDTSWGGSG